MFWGQRISFGNMFKLKVWSWGIVSFTDILPLVTMVKQHSPRRVEATTFSSNMHDTHDHLWYVIQRYSIKLLQVKQLWNWIMAVSKSTQTRVEMTEIKQVPTSSLQRLSGLKLIKYSYMKIIIWLWYKMVVSSGRIQFLSVVTIHSHKLLKRVVTTLLYKLLYGNSLRKEELGEK